MAMPMTPVHVGGRQPLRGLAKAAAVIVWIAGAPGPLAVFLSAFTFGTSANTGEIRIRGRFEITADGASAGSYPVDLQPGQSATFNGTTTNRLYNSPGATGQIYWEGTVTPS